MLDSGRFSCRLPVRLCRCGIGILDASTIEIADGVLNHSGSEFARTARFHGGRRLWNIERFQITSHHIERRCGTSGYVIAQCRLWRSITVRLNGQRGSSVPLDLRLAKVRFCIQSPLSRCFVLGPTQATSRMADFSEGQLGSGPSQNQHYLVCQNAY